MKPLSSCLTVALVTIGMLAAVACGKASKDDKPAEARTTAAALAKASCDMTAEVGSCNEYKDGTTFGLEKSLCEGFKGRFTMGACPTNDQVGICELSDGEVKRYYGASAKEHAYTAEDAKSDCESELVKGKYTAVAGAKSAKK